MTIVMNWGWPQYVIAVLVIANLIMASYLHGKPKTGNYNFWVQILNDILITAILWFGGFWK